MRSVKIPSLLAVALAVAFASGGGRARAQEQDPEIAAARARVAEVRARLSHEPTARETTRVALRFFRVHPDALDSLRSSARMRALLPVITGGFRYNDTRTAQFEQQTITDPRDVNLNLNTRDNGFSVGLSWDLREAIFNGDQIQIYSLVGIQRDIMLECLRAYFARRQLVLIAALRPPEDPIALAALELRIEEFTAVIDALTGEWFSRTVEARTRGGH